MIGSALFTRSTIEDMKSRYGSAALAGACAFAVVAFAMASTMEKPARPLDYFLCGAAGTFAALLAVFVALVNPTHLKTFFYKERRLVKRLEPPAGSGRSSGKHITLGI